MNKQTRRVVAHIHESFFIGSETFIHHYISNHKRYDPICLAGRFINLDKFSFPKKDRYRIGTKPFTLEWFLSKALNKDHKASEAILDRKADLIHAHFGPIGVYVVKKILPLLKNRRVPVVTTFYGCDISRMTRARKWKTLYSDLFQSGDLFLVEGPYMKSQLAKIGCPESKIRIQRIGIPVDEISLLNRQQKRDGQKTVILFCGRFTEKKGIFSALRALKAIREKRSDFEFRLVGSGHLRRSIERYISRENMGSYVTLLGFVSHKDYLKELSLADIFLHPSETAPDGDSEGGAPTVILEAQAAGIPVISTDHADIPNIVIPNVSALLSEEKNIDGLIQNITKLLDNRHSWAAMGLAGRDFVHSQHNIDLEVDRLEALYDLVLEQNPRRMQR